MKIVTRIHALVGNKRWLIITAAAVLLVCVGLMIRFLSGRTETEPPASSDTQSQEVEEVIAQPVLDYDNHVTRKSCTTDKVLLSNDFSESLDAGVTESYHKSSFFGGTAALEDGWARLTSANHLFVFGWHTWGDYGGVKFSTGKTYTLSFDLKKGSTNSNNIFTLNLAEEIVGEDPRYGTQLKQVVLDFSDIENLVSYNSDKGSFASVKYDGETGVCHIEIRFTVDRGANNYLVNSRDSTSYNNWLIDNLYIAEITEADSDFEWIAEDTQTTYSYSTGASASAAVRRVLLNETFDTAAGIVLENGGRNAFFGPDQVVYDNGAARLTTGQHLFVFGRFSKWNNNFGGVEFEKSHDYRLSFDLKLGDARTQKVFNLYILQEDNPDPRFGTVLSTLTLDFEDLYQAGTSGKTDYFVKVNTDRFASVTYDSKTRTAHIEITFTRSTEQDIQVVSKGSGDNEWLIDNVYIADITPPVIVTKYDYSNGVSFDNYAVKSSLFSNDFSSDANLGVVKSWQKPAFFGSTAALENGAVRVTSTEHVFTFGGHSWGEYGGVSLTKGATYRMSFDLQLGDANANRTFTLYVMTENEDPRYGNVEKTLTLNFMDYRNLVTENIGNFASVTYSSQSDWAHIEIVFTTDANRNTQLVSRSRGTNDWLLDNVTFEEVSLVCPGHVDANGDGVCDICGRTIVVERDYDNGVNLSSYETVSTLFENDFSSDVNKGVVNAWEKSPFFGSTATLADGWAHIQSSEQAFVYGGHSWGNYGAVSLAKGTTYKLSFDLKLGDEDAQRVFNLYVMTENGDARYGDIVKTLTLNFADFTNFVTTNTDGFASVRYTAATHAAHVELVFTTDSTLNTQLVARQAGANDWYLDNLRIEAVKEKIIAEKDYDNGVTLLDYSTVSTAYQNDFSTDVNAGVTQPWHKSPFFDSAAVLADGWVRITSGQHVFVYGGHTYGNYGGMSFDKDKWYAVSFDLKLGDEDAERLFNLYVMTENGDPRFGDIVKTLTLDFSDFDSFVTANTDDFAGVTYDAQTHTAHVELLFRTDADVKTQLVSRQIGANNWLVDNMLIEQVAIQCAEHVDADGDGYCDICGRQIVTESDYDNGISWDQYVTTVQKLHNDFSADVNAGVTAAWHKSAFNGSTAVLKDGWAEITSAQHVFTYGAHAYGYYGSVSFKKDQLYKVSLDVKLGDANAQRIFNLYVTTESGDPRFGTIVKTLTLDFSDFENFVTANTDNFASVTYSESTHTAHIEILFKTDASLNTLLVSRLTAEDTAKQNHWLVDNLVIDEAKHENDYSNGISFTDYTVVSTKFENDFSENVNKGVTAAWHKSAF